MKTARKVSLASVVRGRQAGAGSCVSKLLICAWEAVGEARLLADLARAGPATSTRLMAAEQ